MKITSVRAKFEYALTERDLDMLDVTIGRYGGRLYDVDDVRRLALAKHGEHGIEQTKRAQALVVENAQRDRQQRADILRQALEARGLTLRSDSRLCEGFVEYGRGDVASIVNTMDEMRFFHAHTRYPDIVHALMREAWDEVHERRLRGERVPGPNRDALSERAKHKAFTEFVIRHGMLDGRLPLHIRRAVYEHHQQQL